MPRVHLVPSGTMPLASTAEPKSVPLRTPPRFAYASRQAKSTGGQAFVYEAASTNGFRYPALAPSTSGKGFWHQREAKPRI